MLYDVLNVLQNQNLMNLNLDIQNCFMPLTVHLQYLDFDLQIRNKLISPVLVRLFLPFSAFQVLDLCELNHALLVFYYATIYKHKMSADI